MENAGPDHWLFVQRTGHYGHQALQVTKRFRKRIRLVLFRSLPENDPLTRQLETVRDLRDKPVLRGHIVERSTITIDLLVNVGPALDDPPRVVVYNICKQQASFGVKAELNLKVDEGSTLKLPCLLEHQERTTCDAPHLGENFPLLVVTKNVRLRKDEKRFLSVYRLRRIEDPNLRSLFLVN